MDRHDLSFRDVSLITGAGEYTVGLWLQGKSSRIGVNTLRLLVHELNLRQPA